MAAHSRKSPDDFFERDDATSSTDTDPVQQLVQEAAEVFDVSHGDESTAPAWLVIAAFEADYNMNRDDLTFASTCQSPTPSPRAARRSPGSRLSCHLPQRARTR